MLDTHRESAPGYFFLPVRARQSLLIQAPAMTAEEISFFPSPYFFFVPEILFEVHSTAPMK